MVYGTIELRRREPTEPPLVAVEVDWLVLWEYELVFHMPEEGKEQ